MKDNERKIHEEDYLEKILEIREEIAESNSEQLEKINLENEKNKAELLENLKKKLEERDFSSALEDIYKLQYLISIEEAILSQQEKNNS